MNICYLSEGNDVWGSHTGYPRIIHYMRQIEPETRQFRIGSGGRFRNHLGRIIGNHGIRPHRRKYRNLYEWFFYYIYTRRLRPGSVYHILNFDINHPFLSRFDHVPERLIFTLHSPNLAAMTAEYQAYLSRINSAIALYRRDIEWYESFVGKDRVKFVHHGVEIGFFHPAEMDHLPQQPRLLFVGRIYRNTAMLARLVKVMTKRLPKVRFDLVVTAEQRRHDPHIREIAQLPRTTLYTAISDRALRRLYQQSYLLLLPLDDAGANNAVLEALACGLPVVTNDVGGVVDYGGGTIYPTTPVDDDEAMLALIERYLADFQWRNEVAKASRDFAVSHLSWPEVARKHYEIYGVLCF